MVRLLRYNREMQPHHRRLIKFHTEEPQNKEHTITHSYL